MLPKALQMTSPARELVCLNICPSSQGSPCTPGATLLLLFFSPQCRQSLLAGVECKRVTNPEGWERRWGMALLPHVRIP